MKIAVTANYYGPVTPPSFSGGIEILSYYLWKELRNRGYEAYFIVTDDSSIDGDKVLKFGKSQIDGGSPTLSRERLKKLNSILDDLKPDLTISNFTSPSYAKVVAEHSKSVIHYFHGCPKWRNDDTFAKKIIELKSKGNFVAVGVSNFVKDCWNRKYKTEIVDFALPPSPFLIPPPKVTKSEYKADVIYAGRLHRDKGIEFLLYLAKAAPDLKILAVGDPPRQPDWLVEWYKDWIAEARKIPNLEVIEGARPREEVFSWGMAGVMLTPMIDETLSIVGIEAHHLGIPFVVHMKKYPPGVVEYSESGKTVILVDTYGKRREKAGELLAEGVRKAQQLDREYIRNYMKSQPKLSVDKYISSLMEISNYLRREV